MEYKVRNKINTQFNMSSMTDIIFLLLIFLLATIQFVKPTGVVVNLPVSSNKEVKMSQVNVTITANLEYYVEDKKVLLGQFKELLESQFTTKKRGVLLHMDKTVPVDYMIKITDIANRLNATVAVATVLE